MKWFSYISEEFNYRLYKLYNRYKLLVKEFNRIEYSDYIRDYHYNEEVKRRSSFIYYKWKVYILNIKYSTP